MMPYYKRVEEEAGKIVSKMFGGTTIYAEKGRFVLNRPFFFVRGYNGITIRWFRDGRPAMYRKEAPDQKDGS